MRPVPLFAASCTFSLAAACAPESLLDEQGGLFPCETPADCPAHQSCVDGTCWDQTGPSIQVLTPAEEQAFEFQWGIDTRPTTLVVVGEGLRLEPPDGTSEPGAGHLVVEVDGEEVATVEHGDLDVGVSLEVPVPPEPGAHRIVVSAYEGEHTPYANPEATMRRFFWIDDGREWVGFKAPFPGDTFSAHLHDIEVSVATLNFEMVPSEDEMTSGAAGHAHLHYDDRFPACAYFPECDSSPMAELVPVVASTSATTFVVLPQAEPGPVELTASLRQPDHDGYSTTGAPIYESIVVYRRSDG